MNEGSVVCLRKILRYIPRWVLWGFLLLYAAFCYLYGVFCLYVCE